MMHDHIYTSQMLLLYMLHRTEMKFLFLLFPLFRVLILHLQDEEGKHNVCTRYFNTNIYWKTYLLPGLQQDDYKQHSTANS